MEKKSYISSYQVILLLFVMRLMFSTTYQSALLAGNSIQDVLLSIPISFIVNFIIAIPILILLSRHPEYDLIECVNTKAGKGFAAVVAIIYFLFFISDAILNTGNYENFFADAVIPDVQSYVVGIFLIIICFYGAVKGIETIARVGSIAAVIYIIVLVIIALTLLKDMDLGLIKPMLYKGTEYLKGAFFMNYNLNTQIIALAFLSPYILKSQSRVKMYCIWNVLAMVILFGLEFTVITVMGAFSAAHNYPLEVISMLASISTFERIDTFNLISFIFNVVINIGLDIFLCAECLTRIKIFKKRWVAVALSSIIVYVASIYVSHNFSMIQGIMISGYLSIAVTVLTVAIPLIVLIIDLMGGKVAQNERS